jgi:hypothetical protein
MEIEERGREEAKEKERRKQKEETNNEGGVGEPPHCCLDAWGIWFVFSYQKAKKNKNPHAMQEV